jgi:hypothetical protein
MKKLIGGVKRAFLSGRLAEPLANAPVMDHMILHSLRPSCQHRTRPRVDPLSYTQWPWTAMTFPSVAPRWRSTSPSAIESLLTLVSTM